MPNKLEIQTLKKRKEQLEKAIEFTKENKKKIIEISENLINQLNSGRISKQEYEEKLKQALGNKSVEQWLKYYENYLDYYNNQIEICNKLIKQEKYGKIKETVKEKAVPALKISIILVSIALTFSLIFVLKPVFIEKTEVFLKPEAVEKPKIILEQAKILEEAFNQLSAVAGKPVKWKLEFNLDAPSDFNIKLPSESKLVSVKNEQNQEIEAEVSEELIGKEMNLIIKQESTNQKSKKFQIIYETPAPEIKEEIIGENKRLTITAPIAYSNIFSYTELFHEIRKEELGKLKLYQIKNNQRKAVRFTAYDTDENNLYDFIEFIAPEIGEYELVIEISKAEHLDENKNFVSDIYPAIYQLDGIWSEAINNSEYVRVTFEQKLDNTRDITLYPRIIEGQPKIEVYEVNGTEKIAEFSSLNSNEYNKVLLTNLPKEYSQDVFDLKVINGSLEIEYIIDPVYAATLWVDSFNPVNRQWTEVGSSPWLNAQDYPSNYIYANKQNNLHGEFSFQDLPVSATTINSATIYLYINPGTESIQAEVWDGLTWNVFIFSTNGWSWRSVTINFLNTPAKVNNAKLRLRSRSIGGWSGQAMADAAYLSISYNAPNQPPQISYIETIQDQPPIENSVKTITFEIQVTDPDGVEDIDDNSVTAEFSRIGETTRTGNCVWQNNINPNTASYLCSIDMQYYDGAGIWNIKIQARDFSNNLAEDTSSSFAYQDLKSILISPSLLTWPEISPGSVNQILGTSTTITNIGNHEGSITIQATNLYGDIRTAEFINAGSFVADVDSGENACDGTALQNGVFVPIANSMLNKGPIAQEEIFYCIPQVPSVSSQTYSTTSGKWIITVLFASIIIKKRKKKKPTEKLKKNLKEDNLVISLNLLTKELKQDYSEEKEKIIKLLIKEIKKKYKINNKQIKQFIETKKEIKIPLAIFANKLGALETITKYLKENLNMNYKEISVLLQRNERTIWTAYHKAIKKQKQALKVEETKIFLPVSIFNKKLTILESIIVYLKQQNLKYVEIAKLLNRNQRNIWTIYSKAKTKLNGKV